MKRLVIFSLSAWLFTGCTSMPPKEPVAIDEIQGSLHSAIAADQKIAARGYRVPSAVDAALIPSLNPNVGLAQPVAGIQRFNVAVNNIPAKTFFMGLMKDTHSNIIVAPDVDGSISLSLKNVTITDVLDAVRDTYGFDYRRTTYGYEILPAGLQTKIYTVNYLNIDRTGKTETQVNGGQPTQAAPTLNQATGTGGSSTLLGGTAPTSQNNNNDSNDSASSSIETKSKNDFWKTLTVSVKAIVGNTDGRSVVVDPETGIVVVKANANELREVGQFLQNIQNTANRQVILEAKILEVRLSDSYQSGINWNALGLQQTSDNFRANNPEDGVEAMGPLANNILRLHMHAGDFGAIIKLLSTEGNVQTLSSPRIATVNNQKAVIKVGDDEYFVTGVSSLTLGSAGTNNTSQNIQLTPFFSGIALDVTPQIARNGGVILHIHPSISKVIDQTKNIDLGTQNNMRLPLALSSIRESDSVVRAQSGQVIVIGGLMGRSTSEHNGATPWFSSLPFVGNLARDVDQRSTKTELIILLRPIVVGGNVWTQQLTSAAEQYAGLNRGFHFGGKPEIFGTQGETPPYWQQPTH